MMRVAVLTQVTQAAKASSRAFIPRRCLRSGAAMQISETRPPRVVAVLYQACEPPVVNGIRKPKKPGGYQDSGADIAYVLKSQAILVVTPDREPDPADQRGWCFPDTEEGINSALQAGATHLWANTILFAPHPLQTSCTLDRFASEVKVVGQPPRLVEQYDDKNYVNALLRSEGAFDMPKSWTVDAASSLDLSSLPYPIVGKPIRGRGSYGVKVCHSEKELSSHLKDIIEDSPVVMLEEYLSGQEGTVTVMPPSEAIPRHWAMPIFIRFNHDHGIAPYNGVVAVTSNSRVLSQEEFQNDHNYVEIGQQCEAVARLLSVTAPIRLDVRRYADKPHSRFAIFDVNMKPNMTGPGRPGREDQSSLTAMAAASLGWDYADLLTHVLSSAQTLGNLRRATL